MLVFDPQNPFPLRSPGTHTYAEAQRHSEAVDAWLGIRTEQIESDLRARGAPAGHQLWIGLPIQALLTPYTEIREILAQVAPSAGQTVVDLGAGYGRMGLVIARHHPGVRFVGYEYVPERVDEARRSFAALGPATIEILEADLSARDFSPAAADIYFLYDYGTREAIQKTLEDLRQVARGRPITVIGRGRASRDAIERQNPWLSDVVAPAHLGHYSIYRSA